MTRRRAGPKASWTYTLEGVVEYRVAQGLLWDQQHLGRTIYSESLEVRVNGDAITGAGPNSAAPLAEYQWLSDGAVGSQTWQPMQETGGSYVFDLRQAASLSGRLRMTPSAWDEGAADGPLPAGPASKAPSAESHPGLFERLADRLRAAF